MRSYRDVRSVAATTEHWTRARTVCWFSMAIEALDRLEEHCRVTAGLTAGLASLRMAWEARRAGSDMAAAWKDEERKRGWGRARRKRGSAGPKRQRAERDGREEKERKKEKRRL